VCECGSKRGAAIITDPNFGVHVVCPDCSSIISISRDKMQQLRDVLMRGAERCEHALDRASAVPQHVGTGPGDFPAPERCSSAEARSSAAVHSTA